MRPDKSSLDYENVAFRLSFKSSLQLRQRPEAVSPPPSANQPELGRRKQVRLRNTGLRSQQFIAISFQTYELCEPHRSR
jgi:hypothetical protein